VSGKKPITYKNQLGLILLLELEARG